MYQTLVKIRELLSAVLGNSMNYWLDDPSFVSESDLPILAISPISTNINIADNQRDVYDFTIDLILIINAKEELRKHKQEVIGVQYLTEKMEGKDSEGSLMVNTILYIIRHNLRLGDNWNIDNIGNIEYSNRLRGMSDKQFYTKESVIRINVKRLKNR
jgi:hypothetical protein